MKSIIDKLNEKIPLQQLYDFDSVTAQAFRNEELDSPEWIDAETLAFRVLETIEDSVYRFDADDIDGIIEKPLTLCGQILWTCAQRKFRLNQSEELTYDAIFVALKACVAFMYTANIANGYAVEKVISQWDYQDESFEFFYDIIDTLHNFPGTEPKPNSSPISIKIVNYYSQAMQSFGQLEQEQLSLNIPNLSEILISKLNVNSLHNLSIPVNSLLYSFETLLDWLAKHLTVHMLDGYIGQEKDYKPYRNAIINYGPQFAFPSQKAAFRQLKLVAPDKNVMVTYPTSAGKTFIGEVLALEPFFRGEEGLSVHLVPLRALVNQQIHNTPLRNRLRAANIRFTYAMGGYMDDISNITTSGKTFTIATPEAFDYAWRTNLSIRNAMRSVVIDEFQLIEQEVRGVNLECLCSNFLDIQKRLGNIKRMTLLSAVVDQTEDIQKWFNIEENAVLRTRWVPTQKRIEIQNPNKTADFYPQPFETSNAILNYPLNWQFSSGQSRIFSFDEPIQRERAIQQVQRTIGSLAIHLSELLNGGILVVCGSRPTTRDIAYQISTLVAREKLSIIGEVAEIYGNLMDLLEFKYPYYNLLQHVISYRVCYHNAELPSEIRTYLEQLIEKGYFKIVVSTTTLAEGVNLPFRAVILESWVRGGKRFKTLLIRNIVGRAGRAGYYVEGDTIFSDNMDSRTHLNNQGITEEFLLAKSIEIGSGLDELDGEYILQDLDGEELEKERSLIYKLASSIDSLGRLQSFLAEYIYSVDSIDSASDFVNRLFLAVRNPNLASQITTFLNQTLNSHIEREKHPLVTQNSPIRLSSLGINTIVTGLSLNSISAIIDKLENLAPAKPPRKNSLIVSNGLKWDNWLDAIFSDIQSVTEIRASWLKAKVQRNNPINQNNKDLVLWAWYSGWSLPSILWLIKYRDKDNQPKWMWPFDTSSKGRQLEGDLLELQRFCDNWFSYSWNWVLNATAHLSETVEYRVDVNFKLFADQLKYGVQDLLAVEIMKKSRGFPGTREHAQILAQWIRGQGYEINTLLDLATSGVIPNLEQLNNVVLDDKGAGITRIPLKIGERISKWIENLYETDFSKDLDDDTLA